MKLESFFEKFELFADAPNAVAKMRELVLSYALTGRLSERRTSDAPVSDLVESLSTAKEGGFHRGRRTNGVSGEVLVNVGAPIDIPDHWTWISLNEIGTLSGGMTPSKAKTEFWGGDVNWFSSKDIKSEELTESELKVTRTGLESTGLQLYPPGCLVMVARSGILKHTFPVSILRVEGTVNQDLKVLSPFVSGLERYLQLMFRGLNGYITKSLVKTGMTVQSLKFEEFVHQPFPLPPLAEQRRIVAKVDELMALCDQLEAQQKEREARHAVLARASLSRFADEPTPENLNFIFHKSYDITPADLRKTILSLAVRGKLVPQDPNDETAEPRLTNVSLQEERPGKKRQVRRPENTPVGEVDALFKIPPTWVWTRLGQIGDWGSGSTPPRGNHELYGGDISWLKSGELNDNRALVGSEETVTELALKTCSFRLNKSGDVLLAMYGATIGKAAILAESAVTNQAVCGCTPYSKVLNTYLFYFLLSQRESFHAASEGGAQPNISKIKIVGYPFPLPPLAEQGRIVKRVDELMVLVDALEARSAVSAATAKKLLESVVAELTIN